MKAILSNRTSRMLKTQFKERNLQAKDKIFTFSQSSFSRFLKSLHTKYPHKIPIPFKTHDLRTTRAIDIYKQTRDVLKVKAFLRHAKLETTMAYLNAYLVDSAAFIDEPLEPNNGTITLFEDKPKKARGNPMGIPIVFIEKPSKSLEYINSLENEEPRSASKDHFTASSKAKSKKQVSPSQKPLPFRLKKRKQGNVSAEEESEFEEPTKAKEK